MRPAKILGVTMCLSGLTAIISRAFICSVIFMIPISAVMADPALPVTMSAASTGPSSRMMERATAEPSIPVAPNLLKV